VPHDYGYDDDDEDDGRRGGEGAERRFSDFDCPECNANNPTGDDFGNGDELLCNYCGAEFRAVVSDGGRLRMKLL